MEEHDERDEREQREEREERDEQPREKKGPPDVSNMFTLKVDNISARTT